MTLVVRKRVYFAVAEKGAQFTCAGLNMMKTMTTL
jgi:hypothetical protein